MLLVAGVLQWGKAAPPPEKPLVRMVFLETAPPPPPAAAVAPEVARKPSVVQRKIKPVKAAAKRAPQPVMPEPTPAPAMQPPVEMPALTDVAAAAPADAHAAASNGPAGGAAGGLAGGTVGAAGSRVVPASQVTTQPVLVRRVEPDYPKAARREGIEGLVVVEAILDERGRIEPGPRILRSVPMLDEEALSAVQKWRFRPARDDDGSPRGVILEIPIRFVLR